MKNIFFFMSLLLVSGPLMGRQFHESVQESSDEGLLSDSDSDDGSSAAGNPEAVNQLLIPLVFPRTLPPRLDDQVLADDQTPPPAPRAVVTRAENRAFVNRYQPVAINLTDLLHNDSGTPAQRIVRLVLQQGFTIVLVA